MLYYQEKYLESCRRYKLGYRQHKTGNRTETIISYLLTTIFLKVIIKLKML